MNGSKRPGNFWLSKLRQRAATRRAGAEHWDASEAIVFGSEIERRAAIKYFNAAFRAEQSGSGQAEELASAVASWDPDLGETLDLYGREEAWHRELLTGLLQQMGGEVLPMGRVTRLFFEAYGRAERMETIVLTNLMFETIGATTYRLTLPHVSSPPLQRMLKILSRDEAFHVPLNTYFLERVLERCSAADVRRLKVVYALLFSALVLLPWASRPKSRAFDRLGTFELARAYAGALAQLFTEYPHIPLRPPAWVDWVFRTSPGSRASRRPSAG